MHAMTHSRDNPHAHLVVSDIRFQDEADVLTEVGGVVWRVDRQVPSASSEATAVKANAADVPAAMSTDAGSSASAATNGAAAALQHKSETSVEHLVGVQKEIANHGTLDDLYRTVDTLVASLQQSDAPDAKRVHT